MSGLLRLLIFIFLLPRYLTSSTIDPGGVRDGLPVTTLDISMLLVTIIQVQIYFQTKKEFANFRLLVVGAVKRISSITIPWLGVNAVFMILSMVRGCEQSRMY